MKKTKAIGYDLCNVTWNNIDEFPRLWNKTDVETKDKIVNGTGELAVKLVSEAATKNEIVLPIFGVIHWAFFPEQTPNYGDEILLVYPPEQMTNPIVTIYDRNTEWIDGCKYAVVTPCV